MTDKQPTSDTPDQLEQIVLRHNSEYSDSLPKTVQDIRQWISDGITPAEVVTRIDRKTDSDIAKEARNELRQEIRKALGL